VLVTSATVFPDAIDVSTELLIVWRDHEAPHLAVGLLCRHPCRLLVVETLDVRAGAECVTTPAGVIYTGVGDITITTDGATLSPLATPPKFGRYNGEAALTGVYAFGQAAMGDGAGISFTSDGVAWVDVAFPKRFDTLDSLTPTADGWVAVVEDKNGFSVLYLPRQ
jgi:hypothetical protein